MFRWFVGQGFLRKTFSSSFSFPMGWSPKSIARGRALSLPLPRTTAVSPHTSLGRSGEEGWLRRSAGTPGTALGRGFSTPFLRRQCTKTTPVHMLTGTVGVGRAHIDNASCARGRVLPGLPAAQLMVEERPGQTILCV